MYRAAQSVPHARKCPVQSTAPAKTRRVPKKSREVNLEVFEILNVRDFGVWRAAGTCDCRPRLMAGSDLSNLLARFLAGVRRARESILRFLGLDTPHGDRGDMRLLSACRIAAVGR